MGDKKMLTTICLMLLLWQIPQPSSAILIEAGVTCSLTNTALPTATPVYELTMDMTIMDLDYGDEKKKANLLLPVDDTNKIEYVAATCDLQLFPDSLDGHYFGTSALTTRLTEPDYLLSSVVVATAPCDQDYTAPTRTVSVAAVRFLETLSSDDTIIHYTCACDPTTSPATCLGTMNSVTPYGITNLAPIEITVTAGTSTSLLIYDCLTKVEIAPGPVAVGTCVYLVLKYSFAVDSNAINIFPYNCKAYSADPNAALTPLATTVDIFDKDGCPITTSQVMQPEHGLTSSLHEGEIGQSPIIWYGGDMILTMFRASATVFFQCTVEYCVSTKDKKCFGKTNEDRCDEKEGGTGIGFRGRRSVPRGDNQTEDLVASLDLVFPWQLPGNQTPNGQTGGDSCFQNASFLAIVVVLLLLLLVALCVSLVLCYKLRNRQHYNEKRVVEHCHVKHGMDNSNMSI